MGFFDYLRQLLGWWSSPEAPEAPTLVADKFPRCYGTDPTFHSLKGTDTSFHKVYRDLSQP